LEEALANINRTLELLNSTSDDPNSHPMIRSTTSTIGSGYWPGANGGFPYSERTFETAQWNKLGGLSQTLSYSSRIDGGFLASLNQLVQDADGNYWGGLLAQVTGSGPGGGFLQNTVNNNIINQIDELMKAFDVSGAGLGPGPISTGVSKVADTQPNTYQDILDKLNKNNNSTIDLALVTAVVEILNQCHTCQPATEDEPAILCGVDRCLVAERNIVLIPAVIAALTQTPKQESNISDMDKLLAEIEKMMKDRNAKWQEEQAKKQAEQKPTNSGGEQGGEQKGGEQGGSFLEKLMQMLQGQGQQGGGGGGGSGPGGFPPNVNPVSNPPTNQGPQGASQNANNAAAQNQQQITNGLNNAANVLNNGTPVPGQPGVTQVNTPNSTITATVGDKEITVKKEDRFYPTLCSFPGGTDPRYDSYRDPNHLMCLPETVDDRMVDAMDNQQLGGERVKEIFLHAFEMQGSSCLNGKCSINDDTSEKHCAAWHFTECDCACVKSTFKSGKIEGFDFNWERIQKEGSPEGKGKIEDKAKGCTYEEAQRHQAAAKKCHAAADDPKLKSARDRFNNTIGGKENIGVPAPCCKSIEFQGQPTVGTITTFEQFLGLPNLPGTEPFTLNGVTYNATSNINLHGDTTGGAAPGTFQTSETNTHTLTNGGLNNTAGGGFNNYNGNGGSPKRAAVTEPEKITINGFGSPSGITIASGFWAGRHGMHNPLETELMLIEEGWELGKIIILQADSTGRGENSYAQRLSAFLTNINRDPETDELIPVTVIAPTSVLREKGGVFYPVGGRWLKFVGGNPGIPL